MAKKTAKKKTPVKKTSPKTPALKKLPEPPANPGALGSPGSIVKTRTPADNKVAGAVSNAVKHGKPATVLVKNSSLAAAAEKLLSQDYPEARVVVKLKASLEVDALWRARK
jgi:hypothetical protein